MPPAELMLPVAGVILFGLLATLLSRRADRLSKRNPEGYVILSIHGFRAALDTMLLTLVWVMILPGLHIPGRLQLLGSTIPASYLFLIVFILFFWLNFRLRLQSRRNF